MYVFDLSFHIDNEAIDMLTQKMNSSLADATKNMEKSISALGSNLMNMILSSDVQIGSASQ